MDCGVHKCLTVILVDSPTASSWKRVCEPFRAPCSSQPKVVGGVRSVISRLVTRSPKRTVSRAPRLRGPHAKGEVCLTNSCYDLITSLENAQQAGRLSHRLRTLVFPSLMIIDEIGYLPISRTGAMFFFQLMSRRYEHAGTVLTSNKGFEEWGEVLGDDVMAAALIDRLLHHCHIVNIRGNSYRMREHRALATRLATAPVKPP